ncbi:MAG TPA: peptidoglycan DD-metalloendopeptidase family protein [Thermoanaerobaculia bacterium]|nr:peptidoglycan DD-metalloendopeptidase family protein [Thermoanaerobaculia bacterium]
MSALRPVLRVALLGGLVLLAPGAIGQSPDPDLERVRREISALEKKLSSVRGRARTAAQELEAIQYELRIRDQEIRMARELQSRLEREQEQVVSRIATLTGSIDRQKKELGERLGALYRLGRLSYLRVLLSMEGASHPFDAISLLSYLVQRDARTVASYRTTRDLLARERIALEQHRSRVLHTRELVQDRQRAMMASEREKERLLARLREESSSSAGRLEELKEKADRLQKLLTFLYQKEEQPGVRASIAEFKGALAWPALGEVTEGFGRQRSDRFATWTMSNGITIRAAPGSEVRAVFEGTVLFSQWFKGYGNLVIIDHGERIFSLYGNTRSNPVSVGQRVAAGDLVGLVMESEEQGPGTLYFELRVENQPVDPQSWLR